MKNILTIGGATKDIFMTLESPNSITFSQRNEAKHYFIFETGKKFEIDHLQAFVGGGAINSAQSFNKHEFNTACYCIIGDDLHGAFILDYLAQEKIDTTLIQTDTNKTTATSYVVSSSSLEESIFVHRGVNAHLDLQHIHPETLKNFSQLYVTSLGKQATQQLASLAEQAHALGIPLAINPGSYQLAKGVTALKQALRYCDVFIVNNAEAKLFMMALIETDETYLKALESRSSNYCPADISLDEPCLLTYPIPSESLFFSIRNYFKEILKMGPKIAVITNGENGVYLATAQNDKIYFHPSLRVKVRDTVGAGDAFGSTFVASMAHGHSLEDSLRNGIINSAAVIEKVGAQTGLLSHDELEMRRRELDQKLLQTFSW